MTWTAPDVERMAEPGIADERAMLEGWLDYHRQTLLMKCAGLSTEQLRLRSAPPSSLSMLGLVRHMAEVERWWFRRCLRQEPVHTLYWTNESPDGDFDDIEAADPETDFATFGAEVEEARRSADGRALDESFRLPRSNRELSLRWVYVHMIEEYARHNGHADLIRERIDGVTGD
jgi:uncharacterized damage-inducible protein DinB